MSSQEYQISQCAFCFINPRAGEFKSNIWLSSITSLNPFLKFIKLTVMRISHQFVRIIARTDIFTCISVEVALLTLSSLIWTGPAIKINIWSNTGNRWWLIMVIMAERSLYFYILLFYQLVNIHNSFKWLLKSLPFLLDTWLLRVKVLFFLRW